MHLFRPLLEQVQILLLRGKLARRTCAVSSVGEKISLTLLAAAAFTSGENRKEMPMPVNTAPRTATWTYVECEWLEGNPPLIGPTSHAIGRGSTVFDGARWFDGMSPDLDLHCQRINRSATNMSLKPLMAAEQIEALALEGVGKFDGRTAIYIKPMYWAEHGTPYSVVAPDPESTRFALYIGQASCRDKGCL